MASTTYYCTDQDIIDRARKAGVLARADDDASGALSATELTYVTDSKVAACATIDGYLTPVIPLPLTQDDGSLNQWLRDRAISLAVEHLCGRGGGGVPGSVTANADRARADLLLVSRKTTRVPSLTYPIDGTDETIRRAFGRPIAANPPVTRTAWGRRNWRY